jgi:hypothetical protein
MRVATQLSEASAEKNAEEIEAEIRGASFYSNSADLSVH